jgi:hypothetical protein
MSSENRYERMSVEELQHLLEELTPRLITADQVARDAAAKLATAQTVHAQAHGAWDLLNRKKQQIEVALEHYIANQQRQELFDQVLARIQADVELFAAADNPIGEALASALRAMLRTPTIVERLLDLIEPVVTGKRENDFRMKIRVKGMYSLQIALVWPGKYYILYREAAKLDEIQALYARFRPAAPTLKVDNTLVAIEFDTEDQPLLSRPVALLTVPHARNETIVAPFPFSIGTFGEDIAQHLLNDDISIGKLLLVR